jgi:hypothetical protein
MFLSAVDIGDGVNVGALVAEVLSELQMSHKEAGIICGYKETDRSGFSRALVAEQPLDLWRMRHLPILFWLRFIPKLASALIGDWFDGAVGERRVMAKAQLGNSSQQRRSA